MEKEKLPLIPTPASQRWREFRIQILPFLVFIAIMAGIVYLWRAYVQPSGVIGSAETNMVNVTTLQDGLLTELFVERFQNVVTGQVIAVVVAADPELLKTQIASAQADLEVLRRRMETDQLQAEQSYQKFSEQMLIAQVALAVDRANLFLYSNDWRRAELLYKEEHSIISAAAMDSAKAKYEATLASIAAREELIEGYKHRFNVLRPTNSPPGSTAQSDPIDAAIAAKAAELEVMLRPVSLKAPINGMVSMILHLPGERIVKGTPIVSISDPETRRIVAYIRQPVVEVPTTNDAVQITTRSQPRQVGRGPILRIGAQMEPINPALLSPDTKRMEVGLPILVGVPDGMRLLPGEFVNLTILPKR